MIWHAKGMLPIAAEMPVTLPLFRCLELILQFQLTRARYFAIACTLHKNYGWTEYISLLERRYNCQKIYTIFGSVDYLNKASKGSIYKYVYITILSVSWASVLSYPLELLRCIYGSPVWLKSADEQPEHLQDTSDPEWNARSSLNVLFLARFVTPQ